MRIDDVDAVGVALMIWKATRRVLGEGAVDITITPALMHGGKEVPLSGAGEVRQLPERNKTEDVF